MPPAVLIANRGEIARRVARAARAVGLRAVAVYSADDARAPHTLDANAAVCLGGGGLADTYLSVERVIEAARAAGAGLVHPGYGFLSERPALAEACEAAGLKLVGPSAAAIRAMGDKRAARRAVAARGVPCVPGYDGEGAEEGVGEGAAEGDARDARLIAEAARVGYPLMIKAAAGGGGRGMRLAHSPAELPAALAAARAEARGAFGDDALLIERALLRARHIEVQVFADQGGRVVHIGERECSLQRRHQKVIEECPSPAVSEELRARLGAAAVEAARAVGYEGAGTVEFLLDEEGAFYFLEMNTRIQVEHPVTEEVYGVDLVALQLEVALGAPLPWTQEEVSARRRGHAVEARLYAEDGARGFTPQAGPVYAWRPPAGEGVRVDEAVGEEVSDRYDPLLAKIIAHAPTRAAALRRLARALDETLLVGPHHNLPFLRGLLDAPQVTSGALHTRLIDEELWPAPRALPTPHEWARAAVALSFAHPLCAPLPPGAPPRAAGEGLHHDGFGLTRPAEWPLRVSLEADGFDLTPLPPAARRAAEEGGRLTRELWVRQRGEVSGEVSGEQGGEARYEVSARGEEPVEVRGLRFTHEEGLLSWREPAAEGAALTARHQQRAHIAPPAPDEGARCVLVRESGEQLPFRDLTYTRAPRRRPEEEEGASDGAVRAPMSGRLARWLVEVGARVEEGEGVCVVEAMKLERVVPAPVGGALVERRVAEGARVRQGEGLGEVR